MVLMMPLVMSFLSNSPIEKEKQATQSHFSSSPPPPSSRTENLELQRGKYKTVFSSVLLPLGISVPLLKKFKHSIKKTRGKKGGSQLLNMCGKNHRTSEIDKYIV